MRRELRGYYDVTVFVDCPRETCLRRGLARDGEGARGVWEGQWLPAEESYFARHAPRAAADVVVDGSGFGRLDGEGHPLPRERNANS